LFPLANEQVIIITNSDDGWVKYSCERYLPRMLPVIARYRIVSARTQYECFYPSQPLCWKAAAFAHEVNECFESYLPFPDDDGDDDWQDANGSLTDTSSSSSSSTSDDSSSETSGGARRRFSSSSWSSAAPERKRREILSFGDSMEERTAVRIVAEQLSATPKSVTFLTAPTPTQIIGQLAMLTSNMPHVSAHSTSLDLEITAEQAETCAASVLRGRGHYLGDVQSAAIAAAASSKDSSHCAEAAIGALSVDGEARAT
jgi:hypothetical protein